MVLNLNNFFTTTINTCTVNYFIVALLAISPITGHSWIDHFFDFHLEKEKQYEGYSEWNDLGLTQEEWDNWVRDSEKDNSRNDDGGRDFTPDRDR
jgi:hypothetical protein